MNKKHTEALFEDAIEQSLLHEGGLVQGNSQAFDTERALEPTTVLDFIQRTQPKSWQALQATQGMDTGKLVLESLCKELDIKGMLKVLRHGFKCYGRLLRVAFFAPSNGLNPETLALYSQNQVSVTRQLYFSAKDNKSLDLVLFLNGLPIVTAELKNSLSGQTVEDAKWQYRHKRDPHEKLFEFKKRALVHFAVDQDLVFMTTRLSAGKTVFLPFNLGCEVSPTETGAGNPVVEGDYRTSYLWREVWQRDSLLDIVGQFMHLQADEKRIFVDGVVKRIRKETMIFPRYHQLDAVRRLIAHSQEHGGGHNYLIEHSAGSGKSNSIAWLAHRLSSLHDAEDHKVFDSVVVITDRRVLDQQLQNTIYQFEHKQGVVQKIDEDTRQLVTALATGTPIVITTLQKFPFVNETLEKLNREKAGELAISTAGKRYAVIVDEAHSSQSGETAMDMKYVLNQHGIEEAAARYRMDSLEEESDGVLREMLKRGRQANISFFAFTATPKYKTKHVFDEPGPSGKPPFHKYSMRQAIEEKFILDVLAHYTTYQTYYKLTQSAAHDPQVQRKKAALALARFLTLNPHNINQKTEVMVEHFRAHVRHKIGQRAKAMVVTESRLHAVRYKLAFDAYITSKGYTDVKSLVAFSGTVEDPDFKDKTYTEVGMNGIAERELPETFAGEEYRVLLVAEKYQTGFDQPLLHAMYVDKKLAGIQAVQTLSRLNRMAAGKEDTFVLDFRNRPEEIYAAFKPYYGETLAEEPTDPQHLYRLQHQIEEAQLIFAEEVRDYCEIYFVGKRKESARDQARMNGILDLAVERFKRLDEEAQGEFKSLLISFRNLYGFLSQIMPYQDSELERLYTYIRFLLTKLPRDSSGPGYQLDDEVTLEYYRLQKISEGSIDLGGGETRPLKGPSDVGTGAAGEEEIALSELVKKLNERFGTDFTEADQLFFDQIEAEAVASEDLQQAAKANSERDFGYVFREAFEGLVIDRMDGNEDIFTRIMGDGDFRDLAAEHLLRKVYRTLSKRDGKAR